MRNYKSEAAWARERYTRVGAFIDRDLAEQFKAKLKAENVTCADWLRERIREYLKH